MKLEIKKNINSNAFALACILAILVSNCNTNGEKTYASGDSSNNSIGNVQAVSAGDSHALVLKKDGTLWAFGHNDYDQLGLGSDSDKLWHSVTGSVTAKQVLFPDNSNNNIKAIAAGYYHSLILKNDGTLWAFGKNDYGQLGLGNFADVSTPTKVIFFGNNVKAMAAGGDISFVIKNDGSLWAFGHNDSGQLGLGNTSDSNPTAKQVHFSDGADNSVESVSVGAGHMLVLKTDGSIWSCGHNIWGQLGLGINIDANTPKKVLGFNNDVKEIAAGWAHTLVLKKDGSIWSFGAVGYGQLGFSIDGISSVEILNRSSYYNVAKQATDLSYDNNKISTGGLTALVQKIDGSIWAFGDNQYGQLGLGTVDSSINSQAKPITSLGFDNQTMALGSYSSYILKNNGTLWSFGDNQYGQLGLGHRLDESTPAKVKIP